MTSAFYLPFVPAIPAASALLWALFGRKLGGALTGKLATAAAGVTFLFALASVNGVWPPGGTLPVFTWIAVDTFRADVALLLDPLSAVMILVVTGIGFLIHVYSIGYMEGDAHQARYFAYLNFFMAAMLLLVLADNLLLMFVGWEGVGLCSYLLIGFWYERSAAASAGKKAFIVNRVGDFGLVLGILLAFVTFGTVRFTELLPLVPEVAAHGGVVLTAIALLLFWGAAGKSAQIPLYVWLPDTMEGPTPVSALIHAATMVTAGVYLLARMSPLFAASGVALDVVAAVGAVTALFAASIALVQDDLRRVLAYSTVSQLGYMFLACGVAAFSAGVFHLLTHAFFKALLFLCAGSVMHALSGETNIRRMGGLASKLPMTSLTFLAGAAALAGVPPLAGFFSKDEILWSTFREGHYVLGMMGLMAAGLTAFYMARLWFLVFKGSYRGDAAHPPHESPRTMLLPLQLLAVGAVVVGFLGLPHSSWFERFLAPSVASHAAEGGFSFAEGGVVFVSVFVMLVGVLLARRFYELEPALPERLSVRAKGLYSLVRDKYRVDELYDAVLVRPLDGLSRGVLWKFVDVRLLDGLVNLTGKLVQVSSEILRLTQTGNARTYLFFVLAGWAAIFAWLVSR